MTDQETKISKIRALLDELEAEKGTSDDAAFSHNFDALEVPSIVASVVDLLQPQLLPYEAAIYWHLFRKSILESGEQYARVSVRGMQHGVITSSSGQTSSLSYGSVQDALAALERKGAIAKAGDTTREGTPYKVYIPEEIEPPRVLRRLQPLREWSHEQVKVKSVFPGSPRARRSHGAGASWRISVPVGGH